MIVDDDYDINHLFKIFLEHDGYRVHAFTDPIDSLFLLEENDNKRRNQLTLNNMFK